MNKDQFEGKWHQFKGKIKEKWGKLTDNEMTRINGNYEQFVGSLQKHYGYQKEQAEKEFKNWNWGSSSGKNDAGCKGSCGTDKKWPSERKDEGNRGNRWDSGSKDEDTHGKKRKAG
jgi:uncharacterized protein YjbJ (UPF0337 family)